MEITKMKQMSGRYLYVCKACLKMIFSTAVIITGLIAGVKTASAAEDPVMSAQSGCYSESFMLTISADEGADIYYTTDGSDPLESSTARLYSGAIEIKDRKGESNRLSAVDPASFDAVSAVWKSRTKTFGDSKKAPADDEVDKITVVRAAARESDGTWSDTVTNSYFIGSMKDHINGISEAADSAGVPLSIMSVSVNPEDLFDYENGIYVRGKAFDESLAAALKDGTLRRDSEGARALDANYKKRGRSWERSAHIDYIESNGDDTEVKLQQDCGIRIQGNYSRSDLQKSFRLFARKDYGKKNFKYSFFGDEDKAADGTVMNKYKKLVLRNGGNYAFNGKYNDTYWESLFRNLKCGTTYSRACVVYLDGEYWGLYVLQEDHGNDLLEEKLGVTKDNVIIYKGDAEAYESGYKLDEGTLPEGITDESWYLNDIEDFFDTHSDLTDDNDYNEFIKLVDPESFRDYFAAEVWINNKWDWPGKNWLMWKTTADDGSVYGDGRFRMLFNDLEFGGCQGSRDVNSNALKEDNYKPYGLLDMDTKNPAVKAFAYLMTNSSFRSDFEEKLLSLGNNELNYNTANETLNRFYSSYSPLYRQFFTRFYGADKAQSGMETAKSQSYDNISAFIKARSGYIKNINTWAENFYKNHSIYDSSVSPSPASESTPSASPLSDGDPSVTTAPQPEPASEKDTKTAGINENGSASQSSTESSGNTDQTGAAETSAGSDEISDRAGTAEISGSSAEESEDNRNVPSRVKMKSVKIDKDKKMTVKWKKAENAGKYVIKISRTRNFGDALTIKVNGKKHKLKVSLDKVKKLKNGKAEKIYVKVRAVNTSGKSRLFGKYSKVMSIKAEI